MSEIDLEVDLTRDRLRAALDRLKVVEAELSAAEQLVKNLAEERDKLRGSPFGPGGEIKRLKESLEVALEKRRRMGLRQVIWEKRPEDFYGHEDKVYVVLRVTPKFIYVGWTDDPVGSEGVRYRIDTCGPDRKWGLERAGKIDLEGTFYPEGIDVFRKAQRDK